MILKIEPQKPGHGYEFINKIVGGAVPKDYIPAVNKGIQETNGERRYRRLPDGGREKSPCTVVSFHEVDSSEMAFKIAGSLGFKDGAGRAAAGPAGTGHERGSRDSGRLPGFGDR